MTNIGKKLIRLGNREGFPEGVMIGHYCPACGVTHAFSMAAPNGATWDGDKEAPSFSPGNDIAWGNVLNPKWPFGGGRCRYELRVGVIEFAADCTHSLAGQKVPLPDLPGHLA